MTPDHASSQVDALLATCRTGWTMPRELYLDPRIYELEQERIFGRAWLFVCHASEIPKPGDYMTCELAGRPLIVLRDTQSDVRAFHNVCRHRGSLVCTEVHGHARSLVCPYHQWAYDLNGALLASRHVPAGFDPASLSLAAVAVNVLESLVFVSFAKDPPAFEPVAHDISPQLRPHRLDQAKICSTRRYLVHANWKIVAENARECYHCPGAHPEYCRAVISAATANAPDGVDRASAVQQAQMRRWAAQGLEVEPRPFRPGRFHAVTRYALQPGYVTESADGRPVGPLMGELPDPDVGVLGIGIYPNLLFEACSDYAIAIRHTPAAPDVTEVQMHWLVRAGAAEGRDYDVDRIEAVWRATAEQDWRLCEMNQAGIQSSGYAPGPYSTIEEGCSHFDAWYVSQLRERQQPYRGG